MGTWGSSECQLWLLQCAVGGELMGNQPGQPGKDAGGDEFDEFEKRDKSPDSGTPKSRKSKKDKKEGKSPKSQKAKANAVSNDNPNLVGVAEVQLLRKTTVM